MKQGDLNNKNDMLLDHRFQAWAQKLCETRSIVRSVLIRAGYDSTTVNDIVIAIDEACQNIIRHGYHGETDEEIILQIKRDSNALMISLRDYAPTVSANCMKSRNLDDIRPGGLGCYFIQEVMDEVSVSHPPEGQGNMLWMIKYVYERHSKLREIDGTPDQG